MDAREALRRYLEQRREMGERELVLDGMGVDEVMRILGAASASAPAVNAASGNRDRGIGNPASGEAPPPPPPRETPSVDTEAVQRGDWRAVLRGSAGTDGPLMSRKRTEFVEPGVTNQASPSPASPPVVPLAPKAFTPAEGAGAGGDGTLEDLGPSGITIGGPGTEMFETHTSALTTLEEIANVVAKCTRCPLYRSAKNPVPGVGNPNADLVCVGEAPGEQEDIQGKPFVGASGQLLTKILAAINLSRDDVFICNVLKHRPPGNRNPLPEEVVACSPYLVRQLELIRPKVIVAFGTFAAQTLLDTKLAIGKLRGQIHRYHGVPLVVTYHPAALLRNPSWKRPAWEDVQLARRILDRATGA